MTSLGRTNYREYRRGGYLLSERVRETNKPYATLCTISEMLALKQ